MQIRLLVPFQFYRANQIISPAPDWERYLIGAGAATYDLAGGIPYVPPVVPNRLVPASLVVSPAGAVLGIAGPNGAIIALGGGASATVPGAPTSLVLTAGAGAVTAAFSAPANDGGSAVTNYIVTLSNGTTASGAASPIVISASNGAAVTATVRATNVVGTGPASAASNSVTPTAGTVVTVPGAPTIGTATAGQGVINVTWMAPPTNGGSAVTGYEVTLLNGTVLTVGNVLAAAVPAPAGAAVSATVKAINSQGKSAASAQSNSVVPTAAGKRLLAASTNNRPMGINVSTNAASGAHVSRTALVSRAAYVLGSGEIESFVVSLSNDTYNKAATTQIVVNSMYMQDDAGTMSVLIPANYPIALSANTVDVQSQEFLASVMGTAAKMPGQIVWIRTDATVPLNAAIPIMADRMASSALSSKQIFTVYDPAVTTLSAPTVPGKPTVSSGAALPISSGAWCPVLLARYKDDSPALKVGHILGDSNKSGYSDTTTDMQGKGSGQYMYVGDGTAAQLWSGVNVSVTGVTIAGLSANPNNAYWAKYATFCIDQPAGNTFSSTGTVTAATVLADKKILREQVIAINPAVKRIAIDIGPHTVPATSFTNANAGTLADQSDQSYTPGYGPGGNVEQYRAAMAALVGQPGGYDAFITETLWRSGPDPLKWVANGTFGHYSSDLVHGTTLVERSKALDVRAGVVALMGA